MIIYWKIGCWSEAREFFDRVVCVDTSALSPIDRGRLEHFLDGYSNRDRGILRFRNLFTEIDEIPASETRPVQIVILIDYVEDEAGNETSMGEILRRRTGGQDWISVPSQPPSNDLE